MIIKKKPNNLIPNLIYLYLAISLLIKARKEIKLIIKALI